MSLQTSNVFRLRGGCEHKKVEGFKACGWSCEQQCECEWRLRVCECEQRLDELEYEQRCASGKQI